MHKGKNNMSAIRACVLAGMAFAIASGFSASADPGAAQTPEARVVWWVAADPHVGFGIHPEHYAHGRTGADAAEKFPGQHLRTSVEDVNQLGIPDYAVMLGDLVADSKDLADAFVREMDRLETPYGWSYILGNHDFDGRDGKEKGQPVLPVRYNARTVLGMRFIFLSTGRGGELAGGEEQEKWFWNELSRHRGTKTPIVLFTHHPHDNGFRLWPRLKEVLHECNIVAWFAGHSHNWRVREDSGHGFAQITVHSIGGSRDDCLGSFLWMERKGDTVEFTVRFRNHRSREWIEADGKERLTFPVRLAR